MSARGHGKHRASDPASETRRYPCPVLFPSRVYTADKVSGGCGSAGLGRGTFSVPVPYVLTVTALHMTLGFAWTQRHLRHETRLSSSEITQGALRHARVFPMHTVPELLGRCGSLEQCHSPRCLLGNGAVRVCRAEDEGRPGSISPAEMMEGCVCMEGGGADRGAMAAAMPREQKQMAAFIRAMQRSAAAWDKGWREHVMQ